MTARTNTIGLYRDRGRNLAFTLNGEWESRQCRWCERDYIYPYYGGYCCCNDCNWG